MFIPLFYVAGSETTRFWLGFLNRFCCNNVITCLSCQVYNRYVLSMCNVLWFIVVVPYCYRLINLTEHTLLRKGTMIYTSGLLMSNKWLLGNETAMDIVYFLQCNKLYMKKIVVLWFMTPESLVGGYRHYPFTRLHGVTSQETAIITNATWNPQNIHGHIATWRKLRNGGLWMKEFVM